MNEQIEARIKLGAHWLYQATNYLKPGTPGRGAIIRDAICHLIDALDEGLDGPNGENADLYEKAGQEHFKALFPTSEYPFKDASASAQ